MYAAVRRYQADPGAAEEIGRRAREGFGPIISQAPGFVSWYVMHAGDGVIVTMSVFEDLVGAVESSTLAADWIKQNLSWLLPNPPEVMAGKVLAHQARGEG